MSQPGEKRPLKSEREDFTDSLDSVNGFRIHLRQPLPCFLPLLVCLLSQPQRNAENQKNPGKQHQGEQRMEHSLHDENNRRYRHSYHKSSCRMGKKPLQHLYVGYQGGGHFPCSGVQKSRRRHPFHGLVQLEPHISQNTEGGFMGKPHIGKIHRRPQSDQRSQRPEQGFDKIRTGAGESGSDQKSCQRRTKDGEQVLKNAADHSNKNIAAAGADIGQQLDKSIQLNPFQK